jgi:hypothetical protein
MQLWILSAGRHCDLPWALREEGHRCARPRRSAGRAVLLTPVIKMSVSSADEVFGTSRVLTCRRELLDRTLIWNQRHLPHVLREYETFNNGHRPHQGITNARPVKPLPEPITDSDYLASLKIHRRDRLGGILREYQHAA